MSSNARSFSNNPVSGNARVDSKMTGAEIVDKRSEVQMIAVYLDESVHIRSLLQQLLQARWCTPQQLR
jgi:hypothetical protein